MASQISETFASLVQSGVKKCAIVDSNGYTQQSHEFNPQSGYKVKVLADLAQNLAELVGDKFESISILGDNDEHLVQNLSSEMTLYVSK